MPPGTAEILECWFEKRPIRDEYLIVDGGKLAGTGAHSYSVRATLPAGRKKRRSSRRRSRPVRHLTAPTTTPRVSVRWKIRKKITVGAMPRSEAAACKTGSDRFCPRVRPIATDTV